MRAKNLIAAVFAILIWAISAAAFGPASAQTANQISGQEYFDRVDVTVRFDKDGSLSVREELDYVKPRGERKRGIFRELPVRVKEGDIEYDRKYNLTSVTRNGNRETVNTQTGNGTLLWRLGRSDVFLEEGIQKYVLEYNSDDWVFRYDDLDGVKWNVWGEYSLMPVNKLTGRIILPEGATAESIDAYSGRYGRTGNDLKITQNGNVIEFESTKPLAPREGASMYVTVEKGVFNPLSASEKQARWWRAYGAFLGLTLLSPVILLFYLRNWSRVGRDPVKPPVFARYEPPKNYSAAAAHRILKKGVHGDSALISTLLSLAIKGRIKIDVTKKETVLTPLPQSAYKHGKLNSEESILFGNIFKRGLDEVVLRKDQPNSRFHKAHTLFDMQLNTNYSTEYRRINFKYIAMGIGLTALGIAAVFSSFLIPSSMVFWGLIAGLVLINIIFMYLMPAPTKKGAQISSEIEGFKLYLETAEKLRLNAAEVGTDQVPPMTIERYESFLPYAVALGVEKPWTKHFEKTLPHVAKDYDPGYYNSYRSGGFGSGGAGGISRDITKSLSSGVASARPIQTSSGGSSSRSGGFSSGGGFSGGGGGGGGAGSW